MKVCAFGLLFAGFCLGTTSLAPSLAWAQGGSTQPGAGSDASAIGTVLKVTGIAHIEHPDAILVQANLPPNGSGQAEDNERVYRGDVIQTGVDGELRIVFADGSTFVVSSNARMKVDEFVYDPNGHSNSSLVSLSKGTFNIIAGAVAHTGDMRVDTPLGTMGIRGTAPRVEISEDGTVKFSTLIEQK